MNDTGVQARGHPPRTKILSVDSEKSLTTLLKTNLEATGKYEVRIENYPEHALEAMRQFQPDIVLLAIVMPRMPGGKVLEAIRADPELKQTPVVFLTAAVRKSQLAETGGLICGVPVLAKPCSIEDIIEAIERYARR